MTDIVSNNRDHIGGLGAATSNKTRFDDDLQQAIDYEVKEIARLDASRAIIEAQLIAKREQEENYLKQKIKEVLTKELNTSQRYERDVNEMASYSAQNLMKLYIESNGYMEKESNADIFIAIYKRFVELAKGK